MIKEQKQKLESETDALSSTKDKLAKLEMHAYFSQEKQLIFDLGYKQGKFRDTASEIEKLIRQHNPTLKFKFEEFIMFVKVLL